MEAAEKNMPIAQCVIGECYLEGFGIEANRRQAEYWLKRAAANNNDRAKELLSKHFKQ